MAAAADAAYIAAGSWVLPKAGDSKTQAPDKTRTWSSEGISAAVASSPQLEVEKDGSGLLNGEQSDLDVLGLALRGMHFSARR
ncbi:hypothetical protein PpBr36_07533 [Pyricularia pennisetigena]|uniref:hypothetical protein n=1 Tax=Pyricularia pennisetigena TaxID=1578925 RepID=UPI0011527FF3|nr:hypothetical protein PpBr36_07533 [Pyricularia pennisetigena]TLS25869.1 hypothetical protein PpBr36_07533 [Pyricularia pennisetigena]